MTCNAPIVTGRPGSPVVGGTSSTQCGAEDVLFDGTSTSTFSPLFIVLPGQTVRVSAFDWPASAMPGDYIGINRLVMSSASMPQAQSCAPCAPGQVPPTAPSIPLGERPEVTNGKPWQITAANNTLLINVPGSYRLQLSTEELLGVYVERSTFSDQIMMSPVHAGSQVDV